MHQDFAQCASIASSAGCKTHVLARIHAAQVVQDKGTGAVRVFDEDVVWIHLHWLPICKGRQHYHRRDAAGDRRLACLGVTVMGQCWGGHPWTSDPWWGAPLATLTQSPIPFPRPLPTMWPQKVGSQLEAGSRQRDQTPQRTHRTSVAWPLQTHSDIARVPHHHPIKPLRPYNGSLLGGGPADERLPWEEPCPPQIPRLDR